MQLVARGLSTPVPWSARLPGRPRSDIIFRVNVVCGKQRRKPRHPTWNPDETRSGRGNVLGVGGSATTMTWKSGDKFITVKFLNDKVVAKDTSNL